MPHITFGQLHFVQNILVRGQLGPMYFIQTIFVQIILVRILFAPI